MPTPPWMKLAVDAYVNKRNNITLELVSGLGTMPQPDVVRRPEECAAPAAASQPPDAAYVEEQIATGGFPIHPDSCGITNENNTAKPAV